MNYKKYIFIYLLLDSICIITCNKSISTYFLSKLEQMNKLRKPVYTFVKTDKEANIKWGVRHYVPRATDIKNN